MGTFNVPKLAFDGNNGIGHSGVIREECHELDRDVVGLQETRRDGPDPFAAAGYTIFCSGADGSKLEGKGTHGVGLYSSCWRVYCGIGGKGRSGCGVHRGVYQCETDEVSRRTRGQINWGIGCCRLCPYRRKAPPTRDKDHSRKALDSVITGVPTPRPDGRECSYWQTRGRECGQRGARCIRTRPTER